MAAVLYGSKLSASKYHNWVKAGLGVLFTKEVLEPFVYDEIKQFQQKNLIGIWQNNSLQVGTTCSNCCTENVVVCPTNRICNARRGTCSYHKNAATQYLQAGCPNQICHHFKHEIQTAHRYYGPSYKNTDATQWCSNPWEVAKCFMPPDGYKDVTSVTETDFNGINSVIINCKHFQSKVNDDLSKRNNIFEKAREVGNTVRHSPNLEVDDADLLQYFNTLQQLLSDPGYLASSTDAQNAKMKLSHLLNDTLVIGIDDVRKVLDDVAKTVRDAIRTEKDTFKTEAVTKKLEFITITQKSISDIEHQKTLTLLQLNGTLKSAIAEINDACNEGVTKVKCEADAGVNNIELATNDGVQNLESKVETGVKNIENARNKSLKNMELKANTGLKRIEVAANEGIKKIELKAEYGENIIDIAATAGVQNVHLEAENAVKQIEIASNAGVTQTESTANYGIKQVHIAANAGVKMIDKEAEKKVEEIKIIAAEGGNKMALEVDTGLRQIGSSAYKEVKKIGLEADKKVKQIETIATECLKKMESEAESMKKKIIVGFDYDEKVIELEGDNGVKHIETCSELEVKGLNTEADSGMKQITVAVDEGVNQIESETDIGVNKIRLEADDAVKQVRETMKKTSKEDRYNRLKHREASKPRRSFFNRIFCGGTETDEKMKDVKENLIRFYRKKFRTLPLSPLIEREDTDLLKFYVMPRLNSVEHLRSFGGGREKKSEVTSLLDVFCRKNGLFREIYLSADAGLGKTALSRRLALTWCQAHKRIKEERKFFKKDDIKAMAKFDFVFLLPLRECSNDCDIDQMIMKRVIPSLANTSVTLRDIETILSKTKCLIILDGLDEWTHPASACHLGSSDIPHRKARDCTILTTTRPWKLSVINTKSSEIEQKLEIVGLNKMAANELKRNVLSIFSEKKDEIYIQKRIEEFDSAIKEKGISDLETIPLLLMYILCLWCDEIDLGQSKYELYCQIIELLLKRTIGKTDKMKTIHTSLDGEIAQHLNKNEDCHTHDNFLKALGQLAFATLFSKTKENTLVFFSEIAKTYLTPEYLELGLRSGILTQTTMCEKLTKRSNKISFSHKSVHEFLCACHISQQDKIDIKKIVHRNCISIQSILDMADVFIFLSGKNAEVISFISKELMPVINNDNKTQMLRTLSRFDARHVNPLLNIQNMFLLCLKQCPENKNLCLCLQDLIIDEDNHSIELQQLAIANKSNVKSVTIKNEGICNLDQLTDAYKLSDLCSVDKIYYRGECVDVDIIRMLPRSARSVTIISREWEKNCFVDKPGSWSSDLSKTFQEMSKLQAIYINGFNMRHDVLMEFLSFIIERDTIEEVRIYDLCCTEHGESCPGINLDLKQHSALTTLGVDNIPLCGLNVNVLTLEECVVGKLHQPGLCTSLLKDIKQAKKLQRFSCSYQESSDDIDMMQQIIPSLVQVKEVRLFYLNLGERVISFTSEMVNLEFIYLRAVSMSASFLRAIVQKVEQLPQSVTVNLVGCDVKPTKDFKKVRKYVQSSVLCTVLFDGELKDRVYRFEFETNKA